MQFSLLTVFALLAPIWAAPADIATPAVDALSPSSDALRACQTFVVQAKNGTYKDMYLGPSDPVSIEIANVSEASRFVYNTRNGSVQEIHSPPWLFAVNDEPYGGLGALDYDGIVLTRMLIAECSFDYWPATYRFARQNATAPAGTDEEGEAEKTKKRREAAGASGGDEDLAVPFFLPYGPFRCHNNAGARFFTICRETGMFVGFDKDDRRFSSCEIVELFAIPTCLLHK